MKSIICAFLFLLSVALPAQTTTTSPQTISRYKDGTIVYAFKANGFFLQLPNYASTTTTAYGVDYSFYVKCNRAALFVGYTPLYGSIANNLNASPLNCINYGIQFKLTKPNKASAFYLCLYDLHNRQSNHGFAPQKTNLVNFNPKYQLSFLKNTLSLELGVIAGFRTQENIYSSGGRNNLSPQYGFNVSLAFNFSAFFK